MILRNLTIGLAVAALAACGENSTQGEAEKKVQDTSNKAAADESYPSGGAMPQVSADGDQYETIVDNTFQDAATSPVSTFSIDVDTASYTNVRDMIKSGINPPANAVRIEEMINYFSYNYPQPAAEHPFSVTLETGNAPWKQENRLLKIGLKGKDIAVENRPSSNLVFLIDVSGSMSGRLPLVKEGLKVLAENMMPTDKVSIVVYAGASGLVLEPTSDKNLIIAALDSLSSGGSTNGAAGIQQAYAVAASAKVEGGINRVILATDGDFNVGPSSDEELVALITEQAKLGIELSVLGFGRGNLNDSMMEKISNNGNGNYYYIDSVTEAKRVLGKKLNGTLVTIAKDVKIQVEFNKEVVTSYRLIGYENRVLNNDDFENDQKDAGEIGAGHTVTALYEITPSPGVDIAGAKVAEVRLRYKQPGGVDSILMTSPVTDSGKPTDEQSEDFRFCTAVAGFGMVLRNSAYKGSASHDLVLALATAAKGADLSGDRAEFISLVTQSKAISAKKPDVTTP